MRHCFIVQRDLSLYAIYFNLFHLKRKIPSSAKYTTQSFHKYELKSSRLHAFTQMQFIAHQKWIKTWAHHKKTVEMFSLDQPVICSDHHSNISHTASNFHSQ
ncbi:CLUMA_CG000376, isoform A [Clunio marinus]|uniref:CLUMA_CG000376, isoform A n=1 Tax=Clunio marinus TaxID=568069 RepID=A0A1J1HFB8_9DIPT|nr:CLUMA_CG000376, isoform A [Clunio marinus]